MSKYYVTIGLEMHCEGSTTNSKVFSKSRVKYSEVANENISAVDMGFPGILPVVNKEAVKQAVKMATVLHTRIPEYMYFERKNYYYPDLPKGYQITQNPPEECVGNGGYIDIEREDGTTFRVEIDNFHLEEDAAQLTHLYDTSIINYNRAGVPLFELVTKPCLHSAEDAVSFLEYVRSIYKYLDISEADSKKGQIRCDVNVSISDSENSLGTKVETKNVNSFSAVRDCINYEIKRQSKLKDEGRYDEVVQQTRRWDEESGTTMPMRGKVDAEDYKYFVDPNIPRFKLDSEWVKEIQSTIPELPYERKAKYINEFGLSEYDATVLIKEKGISDYFEECLKLDIDAKQAANWVSVNIVGYLNKYEETIDDFYLTPVMLSDIINNVSNGTISSKQAKEIFFKALEEKKEPKNYISKDNAQLSDRGELEKIIDEILANNETQIQEYKNGKTNLFDYFVGQVMKNTRGKANPVITKEILREKLD
ncbi:MAG: Asp-tRNA(Asn)/Glu-tRNA(Gln) amidotransferase subunit GatB [Firmicutes bacterium]|nr:Asp-tRNA(Asn)/Glu-tRNA(Gln) amidotransferase subunit GatB [Bacillota bacterium]